MKRIWRWLDDTKNWWACIATAMGACLIGGAIVFDGWLLAGWPRPSIVASFVAIVFGAAHFAGQRWARWAGVTWWALLGLTMVVKAMNRGWRLWDLALAALYVAGAWSIYSNFFRRTEESEVEEGSGRPFLSLVLLLREPRFLDAAILAQLATRAWGIEVTSGGGSADSEEENDVDERPVAEVEESSDDEQRAFIVGEAPLYMGFHPSAAFMIHQREEPYVQELDEVAKQIGELRTRKAVLEHRGWVAVDVVRWFGQGNSIEGSYRLIARLLAELADDNVLAIVDPDASRIFCYDPETEQKLRSDNPLASLREWYYSPIVSVGDDDPRMQSAVAEARRRWPEFMAAFESRRPDDDAPFAIKAPFGTDENCEFMWVEVTGIENEIVYGILKNEPAGISELHEGDRVKVAVADVNDWLAIVDDEPLGGFTIKVLAEQAIRERGPGGK